MKYLFISILIIVYIGSCSPENSSHPFASGEVPGSSPVSFEPSLIPEGKIVHKGIFSNDLSSYYFTISDPNFQNFDVLVSRFNSNRWDIPSEAFFNSSNDEHGMSFSPDGQTLFFSSTRPINESDTSFLWRIWISKKENNEWSNPTYLEVPGLESRYISHPSMSTDGTLYFHSSKPDYSDMYIYHAKLKDGICQKAKRMTFDIDATGFCTPYISPDGKYLFFASIEESLPLHYVMRNEEGHWSKPVRLTNEINDASQGNPYILPNGKYFFYTVLEEQTWKVKWVNTQSILAGSR